MQMGQNEMSEYQMTLDKIAGLHDFLQPLWPSFKAELYFQAHSSATFCL